MESSTLLKGYELRERIGAGGFGVVHRAYQSTVGREVAIKIILPKYANQPDFIRRFETEAQLVARLEHPFIVPLFDYWRDPNGAYLVMRYLRGGSLRDSIKQGAYNLETTAFLLEQVTSALELAHRYGVIHRDLKPGNILLDEDGYSYLADFGIAKDIASVDTGITSPDAMIGSPDYLAPEQARSEPVTPQTDIYSLGVVLYEMLAGEHPFPNISPVERMYKHLNEPLPKLANLAPDIGDSVNDVIQKSTAKNPAQRFADALEMAAAFRAAAALDRPDAGESIVELLTRREQDILQLIVSGLSNTEIAEQLVLTVGTVKWYIRQIYKKLRVRNRVQAIVRARELDLIVSDPTIGEEHSVELSTFISMSEPENPYKGLRVFQTADARDFFGREKLTGKLIQRLGERNECARFLAVVGPSGSGKSSLVKAGLIPPLLRGELPGSDRWFIIEVTPSNRPLDELEVALTRVASDKTVNFYDHLSRDKNGLLRVTEMILPDDDSEMVIILDQLEEVFTLTEDEDIRSHFLSLIHAAVTAPRSRVRVIVTLRADFYDRPLQYPEFGELIRNRMETVLPLAADELERAIVKPAERVGVTFEEGLVAAIIDDALYQPGALPLLQYALTELFERRENRTLSHASYQAIGGMVGALAKRADELYQEYDEAGNESIRQMFLRMVTLGEGTVDTRRRVPRSELIAVTNSNEDLMDEIINFYAEYRLLALDHDPVTRSPTVEVAHEAILREWGRLRAWLDSSRHDIRQQRVLAAAVTEWKNANYDPSYLLHGTRLEQFTSWMDQSQLALTQQETRFLEASISEQQRQEDTERERHLRELTLARQAAQAAHQAEGAQRRAANRLRSLAIGLVIFLLIISALAAFLFDARSTAEEARQTSDANAISAQRSAAEAQSLFLASEAKAALNSGMPDLALALILESSHYVPTLPQVQLTLVEVASTGGTQRRLTGHDDQVYALDLSADGRTALSGAWDGTAILWDLETGAQIDRLVTPGNAETYPLRNDRSWVLGNALSPDKRTALLAVRGGILNLALWDFETGEKIRDFMGHQPPPLDVVFSADGRFALSGGMDGTVRLWNIATGEEVQRYEGHSGMVYSVAFSPDGKTILSGSSDTTLIVWDASSGEQLRTFQGHTDTVSSVAFSPHGEKAVSGSFDNTLILWDVPTGEQLQTFAGHTEDVNSVAFSPDGKTVLSGSSDTTLIVWDAATGQTIQQLIGHTSAVYDVAFDPAGQTVVSVSGSQSESADNSLRQWDIATGSEVNRLNTIGIISPDARMGLVGVSLFDISNINIGETAEINAPDETLRLIDLLSGEEYRAFLPSETGIPYLATFSPDGQYLLLAERDPASELTRFKVLDIPDGRLVSELETEIDLERGDGQVERSNADIDALSAAFSPDGSKVLIGGLHRQGRLRNLLLWDVVSGSFIRLFLGHDGGVESVAFSPGGQTALSGGEDTILRLWDVETGEEIRRFDGHPDQIHAVAFGPDDNTALSGDEAGTIIHWDLTTGTALVHYAGHTSGVTALAVSATSHLMISGSVDGDLLLWNLQTGELIHRFAGHADRVYWVQFAPDGHTVFSAGADDTIRQWEVPPYTNLDELSMWLSENRYVPEFTCDQREQYHIEPYCTEDTPSPEPAAIPEPTATPIGPRLAVVGDNRGEIAIGGGEMWIYNGQAGEVLTIQVRADNPAGRTIPPEHLELGLMDTYVVLRGPDHAVLAEGDDIDAPDPERTNSMIEYELDRDGVYEIEVRTWANYEGGAYTLVIGSQLQKTNNATSPSTD